MKLLSRPRHFGQGVVGGAGGRGRVVKFFICYYFIVRS